MPYQLQSSKGGRNAEKVYTMTVEIPARRDPLPPEMRGNARRAPRAATQPRGEVQRKTARRDSRAIAAAQEREWEQRRRREMRKKVFRVLTGADEPKIRTIRSAEKAPFPVGVLFACVLCAVMFMYIIYNSIQLNEVQKNVNALKNELSEQTVAKKELELRLERKNDLIAIEKRAKELGMVRMDELTKYYVTITPEEKIEIVIGN